MSSPTSVPSKKRRIIRRVLITAASLAAVTAIFYGVENYRGQAAWDAIKAEREAKGDSLDYASLIPKPVPDDQNILKAPGMEEMFGSAKPNQPSKPSPWQDYKSLDLNLKSRAAGKPKVGSLTFKVSPGAPSDVAKETSARLESAQRTSPWPEIRSEPSPDHYYYLTQNFPASLPPLDLEIPVAKAPQASEVEAGVKAKDRAPYTYEVRPTSDPLRFELHLTSTNVVSASEYLAWSDTFQTHFDQVLAAAQRPEAYLQGDYSNPSLAPIPRYNPIRSLSRAAGTRCEAHLLLGDSAAALRDLELMEASRRFIASPDFTLVSGMIWIVVAEFELNAAKMGLERHLWDGETCASLQRKVSQFDVFTRMASTLRTERSWCYELAINQWEKTSQLDFMEEQADFITLLRHGPRGWRLQNCAIHNRMLSELIDTFDSKARRISITAFNTYDQKAREMVSNAGIYNYFTAMALPAFDRVIEQGTRTQTQAHLAILACALERHRLDTGSYPEKLESLVPKYLPKIPHQVVNGDPLLYRRETDGGCTIWSIGWDLKDDGGKFQVGDKVDESKADWGWRMAKP